MWEDEEYFDEEHAEADKELERIIALIALIYHKAAEKVRKKALKYMRDFDEQDKEKKRQYEQGIITYEAYKTWRMQMFSTSWYSQMSQDLSREVAQAKLTAAGVINKSIPKIYTGGFNWSWYSVQREAKKSFGYRPIVNTKAMVQLMQNARLPPSYITIDEMLAMSRNQKYLNTAVMQGLAKGESVPDIAKRISVVMPNNDMNASVRTARTMITAAENAGRYEAGLDMQSKGIEISREWVATLDDRTRHEHRVLDGQIKKFPEPFEVDGETLRFPADPLASPHLVINCRCTTRNHYKGISGYEDYRSDAYIDGVSYKQWKKEGV